MYTASSRGALCAISQWRVQSKSDLCALGGSSQLSNPIYEHKSAICHIQLVSWGIQQFHSIYFGMLQVLARCGNLEFEIFCKQEYSTLHRFVDCHFVFKVARNECCSSGHGTGILRPDQKRNSHGAPKSLPLREFSKQEIINKILRLHFWDHTKNRTSIDSVGHFVTGCRASSSLRREASSPKTTTRFALIPQVMFGISALYTLNIHATFIMKSL